MGTYYTFITEPLLASDRKIEELETLLQQEKEANPSHFDYIRQTSPRQSLVFFSGYSKNLGGGLYDWPAHMVDVRVVWLDDEGGKGDINCD